MAGKWPYRLAGTLALFLTAVAPAHLAAQDEPTAALLDVPDEEFYPGAVIDEYWRLIETSLHKGDKAVAQRALMRFANVDEPSITSTFLYQISRFNWRLKREERYKRDTVLFRFVFDTLKDHPLSASPAFLEVTNSVYRRGDCDIECKDAVSAAGMKAMESAAPEPFQKEAYQDALFARASYFLESAQIAKAKALMPLVKQGDYGEREFDRVIERAIERFLKADNLDAAGQLASLLPRKSSGAEQFRSARSDKTLGVAQQAEIALNSGDQVGAATLLASLVEERRGKDDAGDRSASQLISETMAALRKNDQPMRALAFAKFAFEQFSDTDEAGRTHFLHLTNAKAEICAASADPDCMRRAARAGEPLIKGAKDELKKDALKWRIFAHLLAGERADAQRLARKLPDSWGSGYPKFIRDVESLLTFTPIANTVLADIYLSVLEGVTPRQRAKHDYLVQGLLSPLATRLLFAGRDEEAEAAQRENYAITLKIADPDSPAGYRANSDLAGLLARQGRWEEAEPYFQRNWELAQAQEDWSYGQEQAVASWAYFLVETGRLAEADAITQRVLRETSDSEDPFPFGQTSYSETRAWVLMRMRRFGEARALYKQIYDASGSSVWNATNLADAIEAEGDFARAEPYRREAARIGDWVIETTSFGSRRERPKLALARNLARQGKAQEAGILFEEMRARASRLDESSSYEIATTSLGFARHLLRSGRAKRAAEESARALRVLASRLDQTGPGVGETAFLSAVAEQREAALVQLESTLQLDGDGSIYSEVLFQAGQRAEANPAASAMALAVTQKLAESAGAGEAVAEWRAAQKTIERLDRQIATLTAKGPSADLERLPVVEARAAAFAGLQATEAELEKAFPRFFDLARPEPVSLEAIRAVLREDEALVVLVPAGRDGVGESFGGMVMVVTKEAEAAVPIALSPAQISKLTTDLHKGLARKGSGETYDFDSDHPFPTVFYSREKAFALYRALFGAPQIAGMLDGKTRWTLVPQGALIAVSYEALVTAEPEGGEEGDVDPEYLRSTAWLGTERALAIAPSVASITLARQTPIAAGQTAVDTGDANVFVGVGDPAFDGEADDPVELPDNIRERGILAAVRAPGAARSYYRGNVANLEALGALERLEGTQIELQTLASVLQAAETTLITQLDATEANVVDLSQSGQLARAGLVVFATHGLIAGDNGIGLGEPALALTPPPGVDQQSLDPTNDGLLSASEAAALKLAADWLILSACNTAAGAGGDAAGLTGLARGFLFAGAKSLLVSHFPVSDQATPLLTSTAVTLRAKDGLGRAAAMQEARRRMLADTRNDSGGMSLAHPKAWAALTLISPE